MQQRSDGESEASLPQPPTLPPAPPPTPRLPPAPPAAPPSALPAPPAAPPSAPPAPPAAPPAAHTSAPPAAPPAPPSAPASPWSQSRTAPVPPPPPPTAPAPPVLPAAADRPASAERAPSTEPTPASYEPAFPTGAPATASSSHDPLVDAGDDTAVTALVDPPAKKSRRTLVIGLIAGAVVLAAGISALFLIPPTSADAGAPDTASAQAAPADVVRDYLSLLENGNAESASLLLDPGVSGAEAELLTDEVLAGAEQRIRAVAVEAVEEGADSASVRATLSLDGEQFDHVFTLDTDADGEWTLNEPLVSAVHVSGDTPLVQVGGMELAVSPPGRTFYLYPGVYTVAGAGGDYLAASTERILVTTPSSNPVEISITTDPTESYRAAVLAQVQERITHCTEVPGNMDRECPRITIDTKLSELSVTLQANDLETFSETHFVSGYAEITVRGVATDANPNPSPKSQRFRVKGSIEVHDGIPRIVAVTSF